jgi:hypothetical protein
MVERDTEFAYDVFISYSHNDGEWVRGWLLPRLEEAGVRVFIDFRDFEAGLPILINMENGIECSRKTLIVLTPAWIRSEWATFESLLVQTEDPAGRRSRFIPLLLKETQLPPRLAILTYADFTDPGTSEYQLDRVVRAVKGEFRALGVAKIAPLSCFVSTSMTQTDVRTVIRDVLVRLNVQPLLMEEIGARPQPMVEVLMELTKEADFVIVDISEASPGVVAEASFAIALSKPLFVLAREGAMIPTILRGYKALSYRSYVELDHHLEQVLVEFLSKRLPSLYSAADS